jgi:ABC-type transport system involved in cytochrome bd biosynthesis fused ATPase/permease subunit
MHYWFDEPSSNLDEISEIKMCEMINKYLKDKTIIIITHREKLKDICNKHFEFINSSLRPICE